MSRERPYWASPGMMIVKATGVEDMDIEPYDEFEPTLPEYVTECDKMDTNGDSDCKFEAAVTSRS